MGLQNEKSQNTIFNFYCPGILGITRHKLLLSSDGRINKQIWEVCSKGVVRVAYFQYGNVFEIENGTMVKYPLEEHWAHGWERMELFLRNYNLTADFIFVAKGNRSKIPRMVY